MKLSPRSSAALGVVVLLLGVIAYLGHLLTAGGGHAAWDRNPVPRTVVTVTAGKSYLISTVDGPGAPPTTTGLACTFREADQTTGAASNLAVAALAADTRATHAVGSFTAPVSGRIEVACTGGTVGSRVVFVDDADDAGVDVAGWLLVLAVALLVVGAGLLLGGLSRLGRGSNAVATGHADPDRDVNPERDDSDSGEQESTVSAVTRDRP